MQFDTYITILFSIITSSVFGTSLLIIITKNPPGNKANGKKYIKILVISAALLMLFATLIYKYKIFFAFCYETALYIRECIPFFYNKLTHLNLDDISNFSFYDLVNLNNDLHLICLLTIYIFFIINFVSEVDLDRKFWHEDLSKILCFIIVVIHLIIVTFFFILAYYILCNANLHIISYILFLLILISLFQPGRRHILWIVYRIQSRITG